MPARVRVSHKAMCGRREARCGRTVGSTGGMGRGWIVGLKQDGCSWCSVAMLGMTLGDRIWRAGEGGEGLHLARFFSCSAQLVCSSECLLGLETELLG